jgi:hypothetical protein
MRGIDSPILEIILLHHLSHRRRTGGPEGLCALSSAARCRDKTIGTRWKRGMACNRFGHPSTTTSEQAAEHYGRAVDRMLSANFV